MLFICSLAVSSINTGDSLFYDKESKERMKVTESGRSKVCDAAHRYFAAKQKLFNSSFACTRLGLYFHLYIHIYLHFHFAQSTTSCRLLLEVIIYKI